MPNLFQKPIIRILVKREAASLAYPRGQTVTQILLFWTSVDSDRNQISVKVGYTNSYPSNTYESAVGLEVMTLPTLLEQREAVIRDVLEEWERVHPYWLKGDTVVACCTDGSLSYKIPLPDFEVILDMVRLETRLAYEIVQNKKHAWILSSLFYYLGVFIREISKNL